MAAVARVVESELDARGIERCVLGGLSMGGYVAFECWRLFRPRIAGLILADTRAAADDEKTRAGRYDAVERIGRGEVEGVLEDQLKKLLSEKTRSGRSDVTDAVRAIMRRTVPTSLIAAQLGMAARRDSGDLLSGIDVPVALIFGEEDAITTVEEGKRMAAEIPDARLTLVPGAGHLSNLEMPAEFNRAVLSLVEDVSRTTEAATGS
jgi:pimeloyl-ACP methyl ester carboxylesterase